MPTNALTSPKLKAWKSYVSNEPFSYGEPKGVPDVIRSEGRGGYYWKPGEGSTRKFGAGIIYLGTRKSEERGIKEKIEAVRLDWDSTTPPKALPGLVLGLAEKFDQDGWQRNRFRGTEIMRKGELLVAAVPGRIRVAGPLGEMATNPVIGELAHQTVVPDTEEIQYGYAQALAGYIDSLRHSAESGYRNAA